MLRHIGNSLVLIRADGGLRALLRALARLFSFSPELLRIRGEQQAPGDPAAAARDYREAIHLARATGAGSLERRAAESLAALTASGPTA